MGVPLLSPLLERRVVEVEGEQTRCPPGVTQTSRSGPPQNGEEQALNFGEEREGAGDVEAISVYILKKLSKTK